MSPVPLLTQDTRRINGISIIFCVANSIRTYRPFHFNGIRRTLRFTIRTVSRLLRRSMNVNVFTQVLTSNNGTYRSFVRVHRIRITTRNGVLNAPIISPRRQIRMQSTKLSNDKMARISRVSLPYGKRRALNVIHVIRLFLNRILRIALRHARGFNGNTQTRDALARRVFLTKANFRFRTNRSNAFLPAIILFLRRRVRLIRSMRPYSMLLFVMLRQFRRTCRNSTTFVLRLFRLFVCGLPFAVCGFGYAVFFSLL